MPNRLQPIAQTQLDVLPLPGYKLHRFRMLSAAHHVGFREFSMSRLCHVWIVALLIGCNSSSAPSPAETAQQGAGSQAVDADPTAIFNQGAELLKHQAAIALLDAAIERDPKAAGLYAERGEMLFNDFDKELQRRLSLLGRRPNPFDASATLDFALNEADLSDDALQTKIEQMGTGGKRLARAFADFRKAAQLSPQDARTQRGLGNVLRAIGNPGKALLRLDAAVRLAPNDAENHRAFGKGYYAAGAFEKAIAEFDVALRLDPNLNSALQDRALAAVELKRFDLAHADLNRAIEIDPNDALSFARRGVTFGRQRDWQPAINDLTKAIELAPRASAFLLLRATSRQLTADFARAIADCDAGIAIDPEDPELYMARAFAKVGLQRFADALPDINAAARLCPDHLVVYQTRQSIYLKLNEPEKARADGKKVEWLQSRDLLIAAVLKSRADSGAWLKLADHLAAGEDVEHAGQVYARILAGDPKSSHALAGRAALRLKAGNAAQAVADATAALAIEPSRTTHSIRGDAYVQLADYDKALADYELARRFDATVANAYRLRSKARKAAGNVQEAEEDLRQALSIDPSLK